MKNKLRKSIGIDPTLDPNKIPNYMYFSLQL